MSQQWCCMLTHYFQERLSRESAQCLDIYRSLTPCSPEKLFPHPSASLIWHRRGIHCIQSPTTYLLCIQAEHLSNSVLKQANPSVTLLCISFPLPVPGTWSKWVLWSAWQLTHQYLLLYSLTLSFNSVHLCKSYTSFMSFLNVVRNSARIEHPLTVVSHHWSNLQTINSLCKRLLAEASSFAGPEN